jgi:L-methionine (R)-S-oxide reductase
LVEREPERSRRLLSSSVIAFFARGVCEGEVIGIVRAGRASHESPSCRRRAKRRNGLFRAFRFRGLPFCLQVSDGRQRRYKGAMSEGISLPPVARGLLLPLDARLARLDEALPQIRAAIAGETDAVAIQATLACLLWETLAQASWCGFYRRVGEATLAVGPYQGTMGCLRIDFARGVCGASARTKSMQLVPDVSKVPDHIACDDRTRSELVLPVVVGGELRAVLDLDSATLAAFDAAEAERLAGLLDHAFENAVFDR